MNPDLPQDSREELEAAVTALLLGELPPEQAAALRLAIERDGALAALHRRLKLTIELVRETAAQPADPAAAQPTPLKLSDRRREELLAHFKTVAPKEFARPRRREWRSPVLVAAAAVLVGLLALAVFLPVLSQGKRRSLAMAPVKYQFALPDGAASRPLEDGSTITQYSGGAYGGYSALQTNIVPYGSPNWARAKAEQDRVAAMLAQANRTTIVLPGNTGAVVAGGGGGGGGMEGKGGTPLTQAQPTAEPTGTDLSAGSILSVAPIRPPSTAPQGGMGGGGVPVHDAIFTIQPTLALAAVAPAAGKPGAAPAPGSPAPAVAAPSPRPPQTLAYAQRRLQRAAPVQGATAGSIETQAQAPILGDVPATGAMFRNEVAQSAAQETELNKLDASRRLDSLDLKVKRSPDQTQAANGAAATAQTKTDHTGIRERDLVARDKLGADIERKWAISLDRVNSNQQVATSVGKAAVAAPLVARSAYTVPSAANAEGKREELKESAKPPGSEMESVQGVRGGVEKGLAQAQAGVDRSDQPARRQRATSAPVPQPEVRTRENAFSTFSLNVSDVSFKLAAASLEKGMMPEPATVRSEEFINAFDYRDPEAPAGVPVAFACERARYPFAQNRDLLRFSLKTAAQGREAGRPLNLVLLLDNSGSMERADRVRIIHEALRVLAAQLQAQDKLSVVTFARTARLRVDGVPGSQAGHVAEEVGGLTPQGGTNLEEALNLAYETALRHYLANGINRVVLLTDGAANLGNVEPEALKQKVEAHRKQGIALDCFGIGWEGYNDDLLEVLSRNGDGRYGFLNTPEEAAAGFAGQLAGALRVAASDVKVQVQFNPARVTAYRQVGYARHQLAKEQFRDNTVSAAQIGAAESGNALYVIEIDPRGDGPLGVVRVRYKVPATGEYREQEWTVAYTGSAAPLEKAGPALRLAAVAGAFSEWLASSPFAAEVTPERLLGYLGGVPDAYGPDARPRKLEWMIRQAQSLGGK
jgi:Mg-chelatase subunit ChlD